MTWERRCEHREEARLRPQTSLARRHASIVLKRTTLATWVEFTGQQRNRKRQQLRADHHFRSTALPKYVIRKGQHPCANPANPSLCCPPCANPANPSLCCPPCANPTNPADPSLCCPPCANHANPSLCCPPPLVLTLLTLLTPPCVAPPCANPTNPANPSLCCPPPPCANPTNPANPSLCCPPCANPANPSLCCPPCANPADPSLCCHLVLTLLTPPCVSFPSC